MGIRQWNARHTAPIPFLPALALCRLPPSAKTNAWWHAAHVPSRLPRPSVCTPPHIFSWRRKARKFGEGKVKGFSRSYMVGMAYGESHHAHQVRRGKETDLFLQKKQVGLSIQTCPPINREHSLRTAPLPIWYTVNLMAWEYRRIGLDATQMCKTPQ